MFILFRRPSPLILLPLLCLSFALLCHASDLKRERLHEANKLIEEGLYKEAEDILLDLKEMPETVFLLGRLYKEEGAFEKAKLFLKRSANEYALLKDYALLMLGDLYMTIGHFDRAIRTVRDIKSPLIRQDTMTIEILSLLGMDDEDRALKVLSRYVKEYPDDIKSRFLLATLYKDKGIKKQAIRLFKDIYINATDLSEESLTELREMKADALTKDELIRRAGNLFDLRDYKMAIKMYEEAMRLADQEEREDILFEIGRCQFRLKEYAISAETFKRVRGSRALYWQARSLYRMDDREGFYRIVERFKKEHPKDVHLAKLLFVVADDLRRGGDLKGAEAVYKDLITRFPQKKEDALWGLAWMYYSAGEYKRAFGYLSRLKKHRNSPSYHKFLYWYLRTCERLGGECVNDSIIKEDDQTSVDGGYYGHLIRLRYRSLPNPVEKEDIRASIKRPEGEVYDRIDALALVGTREWALRAIRHTLPVVKGDDEFLYLCNMAVMMDDYKTVIALNEKRQGEKYLYLSYPIGYRETVRMVSEIYGLDPYLVSALIREESRFDPDAVSWAGAVGLMQLMPETAERVLKKMNGFYIGHIKRDEIVDIKNNILIGTGYLSWLIKEFKRLPYAIAAYNAGENAVREWLSKNKYDDIDAFIEDVPYRETRRYVKKVLRSYWQYRILYGQPVKDS